MLLGKGDKMKDYRLSEMRDICKKHCGDDPCKCCEKQNKGLHDFCLAHFDDTYPAEWDNIEPRDMIELPCKIPMIAINEQALAYQVVYRSVLGTGEIVTRIFDNETDADVFLSYCKKRNS